MIIIEPIVNEDEFKMQVKKEKKIKPSFTDKIMDPELLIKNLIASS